MKTLVTETLVLILQKRMLIPTKYSASLKKNKNLYWIYQFYLLTLNYLVIRFIISRDLAKASRYNTRHSFPKHNKTVWTSVIALLEEGVFHKARRYLHITFCCVLSEQQSFICCPLHWQTTLIVKEIQRECHQKC